MKQLPRIAGLLYGMPWAILPQTHIELGRLYRSYIEGRLPAPAAVVEMEMETEGGTRLEVDPAAGLAIIHLEGVISKRAPRMDCGPALIDLSELDAILDQLAADDRIQTYLFDISSPGGSMVGLLETAEKMRGLADSGRRLLAYADQECCSAAYWLAAACDEFYAHPSAVIGRIGVYCAGTR